MDSKFRIAFTGHRHLLYEDVYVHLSAIHANFPDSIWITGGALGLDSHAANFAMDNDVVLWLILPFSPKVMSKYWSDSQKDFLSMCVKYASKLSVLSPVYDVSIYQLRNLRMVDLSNVLMAFYDGSPGGTANCVKYAVSKGKNINYIL